MSTCLNKIFRVSIIAIVLLAGCLKESSTVKSDRPKSTGTYNTIIEYLQQQKLPALESVEEWENEYSPGIAIKTRHYEIYTTLMEPLMLRQVPGYMESCYQGYNGQFPQPIETETKFRVYLFASRQQWEAFTKSFAGPQASIYCKINAGAYYLNGSCVAYNIGRERTFSVLGHEGWHQFNRRNFKYRLPSWLDEGIAMLFETSRYERGKFYFEPGKNLQRLGSLKKTLLENKMIPLRELVGLNPGEVIGKDVGAVAAFYSQSYTLVRFLREENYGKRLKDYHRMLLGGLNGTWPLSEEGKKIASDRNIRLTVRWNRFVGQKLFAHYVSEDVEDIEEEYLRFCRKIVYRIRLGK
ncbi:MAG: hypothetical protein ACYSSI_08435 [Planctomycetota bacterium]|jgi:hypothetical protein